MSKLQLHNGDCLEYMKSMDDNQFDLAIVDPPYGISINMNQGRRKGNKIRHERKKWDSSAPSPVYFFELFRVSKRVIIWGSNNFELPPSNGWIVWNKDITGDVQFSKAELAYTNFLNTVDMVKIRAQSGIETYSNKIHPTQKPVALYKWILKNYAKHGDTILDTHLGSMSIAIACHDMGFDLTGYELDEDYYKAGIKRVNEHRAQGQLFHPEVKQEITQLKIE